jgi:hypothetical protein
MLVRLSYLRAGIVMGLVGLGALALHRVVLLALGTAVVIAALFAAKSYHSSLVDVAA